MTLRLWDQETGRVRLPGLAGSGEIMVALGGGLYIGQ